MTAMATIEQTYSRRNYDRARQWEPVANADIEWPFDGAEPEFTVFELLLARPRAMGERLAALCHVAHALPSAVAAAEWQRYRDGDVFRGLDNAETQRALFIALREKDAHKRRWLDRQGADVHRHRIPLAHGSRVTPLAHTPTFSQMVRNEESRRSRRREDSNDDDEDDDALACTASVARYELLWRALRHEYALLWFMAQSGLRHWPPTPAQVAQAATRFSSEPIADEQKLVDKMRVLYTIDPAEAITRLVRAGRDATRRFAPPYPDLLGRAFAAALEDDYSDGAYLPHVSYSIVNAPLSEWLPASDAPRYLILRAFYGQKQATRVAIVVRPMRDDGTLDAIVAEASAVPHARDIEASRVRVKADSALAPHADQLKRLAEFFREYNFVGARRKRVYEPRIVASFAQAAVAVDSPFDLADAVWHDLALTADVADELRSRNAVRVDALLVPVPFLIELLGELPDEINRVRRVPSLMAQATLARGGLRAAVRSDDVGAIAAAGTLTERAAVGLYRAACSPESSAAFAHVDLREVAEALGVSTAHLLRHRNANDAFLCQDIGNALALRRLEDELNAVGQDFVDTRASVLGLPFSSDNDGNNESESSADTAERRSEAIDTLGALRAQADALVERIERRAESIRTRIAHEQNGNADAEAQAALDRLERMRQHAVALGTDVSATRYATQRMSDA